MKVLDYKYVYKKIKKAVILFVMVNQKKLHVEGRGEKKSRHPGEK